MSKYVIYLFSDWAMLNDEFGYYAGRINVIEDENAYVPVTDKEITNRTRRYRSRKRAENAAERVYEFTYVEDWVVEEVDE